MRCVVRGLTIASLMVLCLAAIGSAAAGEAMAIVKQTTESVLAVLENAQLQGPDRRMEREERLRKISDGVFDWEEMAKRALAVYWRERTPQERKEFVGLFRDLVERAYMSRLESAVEQRQDVLYLDEQVDGSRAVVKTKVLAKRNLEVPIEYRLHKSSGRWQMYDVAIEGVSLVNNYRSQFNRIVQTSSYEALIQRLKAKQVEESSPGAK